MTQMIVEVHKNNEAIGYVCYDPYNQPFTGDVRESGEYKTYAESIIPDRHELIRNRRNENI